MDRFLARFLRDENGATAIEYGLIAALVFMLSNALVDFALEGFGALFNLALGLFALSIVSYHLARAATSNDGHDQLRV